MGLLLFLAGVGTAAAVAMALCWRGRRNGSDTHAPDREDDGPDMLNTLARGLAHEIRNPLSTMRVNLQLLQEDWAVTSTPREERTARKIAVLQQEVERLEESLNDFVRFARGHELHPTRVNVNEVLSDLLTFFEPQAHQHGVNLRRHLTEGLPDCPLDVDLVKQALLNLMINAQQAMPDGGELIVTSGRQGNDILIDVIDTGTGIDPSIVDQIFQAYFSAKRSGTGLGLALTKRIIEEHGGRIEVASEVGKGSRFRIRLPVTPEPDAPEREEGRT